MGENDVITQSIPVSQARQKLGELVNEVYKRHRRVIVEKSGIPVVALVALSDLDRWLRLEREHETINRSRARGTEKRVPNERAAPAASSADELAQRRELVERILADAEKTDISPLSSADLVRQTREEREEAYERWIR